MNSGGAIAHKAEKDYVSPCATRRETTAFSKFVVKLDAILPLLRRTHLKFKRYAQFHSPGIIETRSRCDCCGAGVFGFARMRRRVRHSSAGYCRLLQIN